ncbi:MAG: LruC domain-containing protein [Mucilaginibacter sp.]|uniref:LruC domain-containing protein n=1 Tax=Mucilaginibacter sp. TaxID=1882438 RepID=UPI003264DEC6
MKKTLLIAAIFGSFAVVSCKKDQNNNIDTAVTSLNDVKVPAGFTWESSRNLNVDVKITDTRFGAATTHSIAVYDGDPYTTGHLLTKGGATSVNDFVATVYVPTTITQLYVVKTSPDNSTIVQKVAAGTSDIHLTIGSVDAAYAVTGKSSAMQSFATAPTSPDCSGGTAITANKSDLDMNSGDVYSVTGNNITVGLRNVNGGTLKVCGTNVTVTGNLSGNGALIVTTSGSVTFTGNLNNNDASITNFGTLTIPGNRADAGHFSNYGVCTINGDCNMNGATAIFYNSGTLTITGGWQGGTTGTATNDGSMVVTKNFQTNKTPFINNCSLYVKQNYNQDQGTVKNYGLIKVDGTSTLNDNVELGLYNSAEFLTVNQIVNGKIIGYGSTSLDKITGTTIIFNNSGAVNGNVQVYAVQGINSQYNSKIVSPATLDNSVYIAKTGCNSDGNGTQVVEDFDKDGVANNLDAYPNDADKAYNITGASGTVAYEDQWPVKGDFDLNDVVVGYSYTLVTSAANKVVTVSGAYTLYSRGGDYTNAFGIEFPVAKGLVSGLAITKGGTAVTAPTFEAGQTNATVILFTNMKDEMATYNTKIGDIFSPYKSYSISFNITGGIALSTFGQDAYNPFIYNSGRGHEVHLSGKTPTSLADATLFGTKDDNTSVAVSRYYVTKAGLPFAINVPVVFNYVSEGKDITTAFLHFADWAAAGGSSYTDWYSNTATGYRNSANIFTH